MELNIQALWVLAAASLLAGCTSVTPVHDATPVAGATPGPTQWATGVVDFTSRAKAVVDQLAAGKFEEATTYFNSNWKEMTLTFSPGSETAMLKMDAVQAEIGLDNLYRVTAVPGSGPLVLKGSWDGSDTFVIDGLNLGEASQVQLRVKYTVSAAIVSFVDWFSNSTIFSVMGFLKE